MRYTLWKEIVRELKDDVSVVDADGVIIVAVGSGSYDEVVIRCDEPGLIRKMRAAADLGEMVEIIPLASRFRAGWDTPLGILAAMMSVAPGRTLILETPCDSLAHILSVSGSNSDPNHVY